MGFGFTAALESWIKTVSKVAIEIGIHPDDGVDHRTIPVGSGKLSSRTSRSQIPALKVMIGAIDMLGF